MSKKSKNRHGKKTTRSQAEAKANTAPTAEESLAGFRQCLTWKKAEYALPVLQRFRKWHDSPEVIEQFRVIVSEFANLGGDLGFSAYLKSPEYQSKFDQAVQRGALDYEKRQTNPKRACDSGEQVLTNLANQFASNRSQSWARSIENYLTKTGDFGIEEKVEQLLEKLYDGAFSQDLLLLKTAVDAARNKISLPPEQPEAEPQSPSTPTIKG